MTPTEFTAALDAKGFKTARAAATYFQVSEGAVSMWRAGKRRIPGPIILALRLTKAAPDSVKTKKLR